MQPMQPHSSAPLRDFTRIIPRPDDRAVSTPVVRGLVTITQGKIKSSKDSVAVTSFIGLDSESRQIVCEEIESLVERNLEQAFHPNVIPVLGFAFFEDMPCLVSPWLGNGDVKEYITRHPEADRQALVYDVTEGLMYLHSLGIVHGDLKPSNILIGDHGEAMLRGFGLPDILGSRAIELYTPRFTAPEILMEVEHSFESDLYSLASVTLFILTGKLPYASIDRPAAVIANQCQGKLPLKEDYPELPGELWNTLAACMTADPEERATMDDLVTTMVVADPDAPKTLDSTPKPGSSPPRTPPPAPLRTPTPPPAPPAVPEIALGTPPRELSGPMQTSRGPSPSDIPPQNLPLSLSMLEPSTPAPPASRTAPAPPRPATFAPPPVPVASAPRPRGVPQPTPPAPVTAPQPPPVQQAPVQPIGRPARSGTSIPEGAQTLSAQEVRLEPSQPPPRPRRQQTASRTPSPVPSVSVPVPPIQRAATPPMPTRRTTVQESSSSASPLLPPAVTGLMSPPSREQDDQSDAPQDSGTEGATSPKQKAPRRRRAGRQMTASPAPSSAGGDLPSADTPPEAYAPLPLLTSSQPRALAPPPPPPQVIAPPPPPEVLAPPPPQATALPPRVNAPQPQAVVPPQSSGPSTGSADTPQAPRPKPRRNRRGKTLASGLDDSGAGSGSDAGAGPR